MTCATRVPLCLWTVLCVSLLCAKVAGGHEMSMAEMEVRQMSPSEFTWRWGPTEKRPASDDLRPSWPNGCSAQDNILVCRHGLRGILAIDGVGKRFSAALVKVFWTDGGVRVYTITAGQPNVHLFGSAEDQRSSAEIAGAYLVLGVEHILTGYDHLLFVLSLLFLVGFNRRLLWTITSFTLAHSLTLACAAFGWLVLRPAAVEATIALSIMLVAGEALRNGQTLSQRWPALVAFLFGLVHGLGFAGALAEIGLPQHDLAAALLTFNLGVETGQLLVVVAAYAAYRFARRHAAAGLLKAPALYGIGSIAAFWTVGRVAAIVLR